MSNSYTITAACPSFNINYLWKGPYFCPKDNVTYTCAYTSTSSVVLMGWTGSGFTCIPQASGCPANSIILTQGAGLSPNPTVVSCVNLSARLLIKVSKYFKIPSMAHINIHIHKKYFVHVFGTCELSYLYNCHTIQTNTVPHSIYLGKSKITFQKPNTNMEDQHHHPGQFHLSILNVNHAYFTTGTQPVLALILTGDIVHCCIGQSASLDQCCIVIQCLTC